MKIGKVLSRIGLCMLLVMCAGCANTGEKEQENSEMAPLESAGEDLGEEKGSQGQEEESDVAQGQTNLQEENAGSGLIGSSKEAESPAEDMVGKEEAHTGVRESEMPGIGQTARETPDTGARADMEFMAVDFIDVEPVTVYTTANVNVRLAPSTEAGILTKAARGTIYEKNGEGEGWSRIGIDGENYYIKSDYIREKKAPGEGGGHRVAIDAGHQSRGNSEKEPLGPGSSEMKAKVSGGTRGTTTGLYEYELTLMVSQKLRDELESRGYEVYMVRESHDVDISNSQRAQMAYDSGAEIFVRIHANGSEDSSANGAMTICPTARNPYVANLYTESRKLSDTILDGLVASTGCKKERVWETDTMSGINWSLIPVTIVEMGYMTNPEEDTRLSDDGYQELIAIGIADGIDTYFE